MTSSSSDDGSHSPAAPPSVRQSHLPHSEAEMIHKVASKATRKAQARQHRQSLWYGLGLFGVVGWSVAIPSLLGIAMGIWIDQHHQGPYSWTLMLLVIGVGVGCLNAWYWIEKESQQD